MGDLSGCVKSSENHKDVAMREDHESSDQKDLVKGSQRLGANVRCKILYTGKELDRLVAESCWNLVWSESNCRINEDLHGKAVFVVYRLHLWKKKGKTVFAFKITT